MDGEAWLASERILIERGEWTPPKSRSANKQSRKFGAYAIDWLENRTLKPRTRQGYQELLDGPLAKWNSVPLTLIDAEGVRHWHTGLGTKTPTKTAHAAETVTRARQSAVIVHQTARQVRTGIENGTPARVLISVDDARKYDPDAASR